jgi:uncharacterized membrane protein YfcA
MWFEITLAAVAVIAGSIASIAGFGIGSLLTPLLASSEGMSVAVVAVSISHFFGTSIRFFLLRKSINRQILLSFGLTSAFGGIAGALLHNTFQSLILTIVFGCLLIVTGIFGITGLTEKIHFKGIVAWILGGISGIFGGLVGNQGTIRSSVLLGFEIDKDQFVATATGIALMVDIARLPVYLATWWEEVTFIWQSIIIMTAGVVAGTFLGRRLLEIIPETIFKKAVSTIILIIGILILIRL